MILYNEELPSDKVERQLYYQIISHLQKYKVAFASEAFWKILATQLTTILSIVSILWVELRLFWIDLPRSAMLGKIIYLLY